MTKNEVLVGLDDSPSALTALEWAAGYARSAKLPLRAVMVITDVHPSSVWGPGYIAVASDGRQVDDLKRSVEAIFSAVHPEPGWRLDFRHGSAGHELLGESGQARLLVVGTREHTGIGRLMVGSVSHHCLSHATCPVVAVPASGVSDPEDPGMRESVAAPTVSPR